MSDIVLEELIGRGGMAEVWRGRCRTARGGWRPVAIKKILPIISSDPEALARFQREADLCIAMNHEHVVKVLEYRRVGDEHWLVMEYIDGVTLAELRDYWNVIPLPVLRAILHHVLHALHYIHACGLLHRDISPANIMITREGEVRLMDFGLCKELAPGAHSLVFKGTPAYASFEALTSKELDSSSDLYSLAAVFYELLVGEPPFKKGTPHVVSLYHMRGVPVQPLPDLLPEDFRTVLIDLLQRQDQRQLTSAVKVLAVLIGRGAKQEIAEPYEIAEYVQDAIAAREQAQGASAHADEKQARLEIEPMRSSAAARLGQSIEPAEPAHDEPAEPADVEPAEDAAAPHKPVRPRTRSSTWRLVAAVAAIVALPAGYCGFRWSQPSSLGRTSVSAGAREDRPADQAASSSPTAASGSFGRYVFDDR